MLIVNIYALEDLVFVPGQSVDSSLFPASHSVLCIRSFGRKTAAHEGEHRELSDWPSLSSVKRARPDRASEINVDLCGMDISKMLADLRAEREQLEQAILVLE